MAIEVIGHAAKGIKYAISFAIAIVSAQYIFGLILVPVLIASSVFCSYIALEALFYTDALATTLVNIALQALAIKDQIPLDRSTQHLFEFNTRARKLQLVMASPLLTIGLALTITTITSYAAGLLLGSKVREVLQDFAQPVVNLLNAPATVLPVMEIAPRISLTSQLQLSAQSASILNVFPRAQSTDGYFADSEDETPATRSDARRDRGNSLGSNPT